METPPTEKLITASELAARLDISLDTVYRMCKSGKWQTVRIGRAYRFTEEHYQAILAPPPTKDRTPRSQRQRIDKLLRGT